MQRPFFMTLRKLATKCITQVQHAVGVNVMQVLWQFRAGTIALGAVALAACGANAASYGTDEGVPLANLDRSGAAPTGSAIALAITRTAPIGANSCTTTTTTATCTTTASHYNITPFSSPTATTSATTTSAVVVSSSATFAFPRTRCPASTAAKRFK